MLKILAGYLDLLETKAVAATTLKSTIIKTFVPSVCYQRVFLCIYIIMDHIIAKNLLLDKTCDNCKATKNGDDCVQWLGEAIGWEWTKRDKRGTCENWIERAGQEPST